MSDTATKGFEPLLDTTEDPAIEFFNLSNKLNRRQRVFVWNVVNNPQMSYVEAARKSGYKELDSQHTKIYQSKKVNYLMGEVREKI